MSYLPKWNKTIQESRTEKCRNIETEAASKGLQIFKNFSFSTVKFASITSAQISTKANAVPWSSLAWQICHPRLALKVHTHGKDKRQSLCWGWSFTDNLSLVPNLIALPGAVHKLLQPRTMAVFWITGLQIRLGGAETEPSLARHPTACLHQERGPASSSAWQLI